MNRYKEKHPKRIIGIVAAVAVGIVVICAYFAVRAENRNSTVQITGNLPSGSLAVDSEGFGNTILYNGKKYQYKTNLKNILFLGIDKGESTVVKEIAARNGRSDVMLLFTLDPAAKTSRMLEISRDTMMDIDVYDANDSFQFSGKMQLTMQYAFSSSARRGCWLAAKKISGLLYGVPVDATVSLTMDGIAPAVDALGGVKITVPEDYTSVSPEFRKGAVLTLDGKQAFQYVHYRDISVTGSNDTRMERQMQFAKAFCREMSQKNSSAVIQKLQKAAKPYLQSDLDAESIQKLVQYQLDDEVLKVPGKTQQGASHDEYDVDDDALRRMVVEKFYVPVK